ncbi:MAG: hypothetical protein ACE5EO_00535 [Candidatus Krumholzibacteriia bacterium]
MTGHAATIQAGIHLAADGDTVLVAAGPYSGAGNVNGEGIRCLGTAAPTLLCNNIFGNAGGDAASIGLARGPRRALYTY